MLPNMRFHSFDVSPTATNMWQHDSLKSFPAGYRTCITNPPWLARNSARRRGLKFPIPDLYDDVYKYALKLALDNCECVAFIIPATFLLTGLFRKRLETFILIEKRLFTDTDNPVCLALFTPKPNSTQIWADDNFIGSLDKLEAAHRHTVTPSHRHTVTPSGSMCQMVN